MIDITHLTLLPALMNRLSAVAPSIQVEITHISNQTPKMLESGDADLAVGYMPALEAGFYQQSCSTRTSPASCSGSTRGCVRA